MVPWWWLILEPFLLVGFLILLAWLFTLLPYRPNEEYKNNGEVLEQELMHPEDRAD